MSMTTVRGWPSSSYFIQGLFFLLDFSQNRFFFFFSFSIVIGIVEVLDSYAQFDHLGLVVNQFVSFYQKRFIFLMKKSRFVLVLDSSGFLEIDGSIHVFCFHDIVTNSFSGIDRLFLLNLASYKCIILPEP